MTWHSEADTLSSVHSGPARNGPNQLMFIRDRLPSLRKSEVKVAEHVLSDPDSVLHLSISELADLASVSEPTVIRFCRGIGFRGYQDFKIALAQSVIPRIKSIHESIGENDDTRTLTTKVFQANLSAIQDSLEDLDFDALENAIELCDAAKRILVFGLGGSAAVAMDAYHKLFRLGIPCNWYEDTHMQVMSASMLGPDDVVIIITHSGSSKDLVEAAELAHEVGARSIVITSHHRSPISRIADVVVSVNTLETNYRFEPMSSRIAHLTVVDAISVGVTLKRQEIYMSNVEQTRRALVRKRY